MEPLTKKPAARALTLGLASLLLLATIAAAQTEPASGPAPVDKPSTMKSPDDGWLDISGFLDTKFGFIPIATVITEPALGLGGAGGLAFVSSPIGSGDGRPNITMVGGMGTDNGTKGAFAGDLRQWLHGRVQTLVGLVYASVNLDYYGLGNDPALADNPLGYNMEPKGGLVEAKFRLGRSPLWVGMRYAYSSTQITFDAPDGTAGLPEYRHSSAVGGLVPSFTLDTRNNLFTPVRGSYVEATVGVFNKTLGGDSEFTRVQVVALQYARLRSNLFLGLRGQYAGTSDSAPFYLRPFVYMRGVEAMRYQGADLAQFETELRWQFWNRFSLVGFGGTGAAWPENDRMEKKTATAGGGGFRYELARKYGLHVGADLAWGPDGRAFYIQFGSAWARP